MCREKENVATAAIPLPKPCVSSTFVTGLRSEASHFLSLVAMASTSSTPALPATFVEGFHDPDVVRKMPWVLYVLHAKCNLPCSAASPGPQVQ